jgi:hypothetical protein
MRLSRFLALGLAGLTAAFSIFTWITTDLSVVAAGLLLTGAALMTLPALARSRGSKARWLLVFATLTYSVFALAALGLQFDQQSSLLVRAGLAAFLMLGISLALRCTYLLNRTTRYGFHNYYDAQR